MDVVDSEESVLTHLPSVLRTSEEVFYISDRPEATVLTLVQGVQGKHHSDLLYARDEKTLLSYIKSPGTDLDLTGGGATEVINLFSKHPPTAPMPPSTAQVLIAAARAMQDLVPKLQTQLSTVAEAALANVSTQGETISSLQKDITQIETVLEEARELVDSLPSESPTVGTQTTFSRLSVDMKKVKNLLLIKRLGPVPYLVSFSMALHAYLKKREQRRTQLIFLIPPGEVWATHYQGYSHVRADNSNNGSDLYSEVVFVSYPTNGVLTKMLYSSGQYEVTIVVDMLDKSKDHLLRCPKPVHYAISGATPMKKFKLNPVNCFSSVTEVKGTRFYIPTWEYPDREYEREAHYFNAMSAQFDTLIQRMT